MRTRDVIGHARKIVFHDLEAIHERRAELMSGARHLIDVREAIEEDLPFTYPGSFFIGKLSPRPGTLLLNAAFLQMGRQESKPAASKVKFTSDVLVPLAGIDAQAPTHEGRWGAAELEACPLADGRFISALQQIRKLRNGDHDKLSAYVDEDGTPVLFRKSYEESTAINLTPLSMEGSGVIPAGTIVSLGAKMNRRQLGEYEGDSFVLGTYAIPQTLEVTPVRLSPWAYDGPADRALFGVRGKVDEIHQRSTRLIQDYPEHTALEDYTEASHRIIELCSKA